MYGRTAGLMGGRMQMAFLSSVIEAGIGVSVMVDGHTHTLLS